ncbi:MAG: hypothetical protein HOC78_01690 [Candidatus Komeilibacteria bacterium]|jgi:hypothetical protein|nr:hypothetical protein [Candidatus Komeilibacteria bacterium]
MTFDPENPRTEDREFHPKQGELDQITEKLARIEEGGNLAEFPDDNAKETFVRSLEAIEDQIKNIREQIG